MGSPSHSHRAACSNGCSDTFSLLPAPGATPTSKPNRSWCELLPGCASPGEEVQSHALSVRCWGAGGEESGGEESGGASCFVLGREGETKQPIREAEGKGEKSQRKPPKHLLSAHHQPTQQWPRWPFLSLGNDASGQSGSRKGGRWKLGQVEGEDEREAS